MSAKQFDALVAAERLRYEENKQRMTPERAWLIYDNNIDDALEILQ